jgi:glycosyltransferase involved in cell wall biosynthesis
MTTQTGKGRPTRLTFLIDSMEARGGMERVTATVASGLARRGLDVQILTLKGTQSAFPLDPGVRLESLNMPSGPLRMRAQTLPLIRALRRWLSAERPDTLIVVDTFLSAFAFPAAFGLNIRRVAWEHFHFHTDLGMRSRRVGRWAAAFLGQQVVTLTQQDTKQWNRAFPGALARIRTISNPLSFPTPRENPYSVGNHTLLAVGRLDSQKGFDLLLEAWAKVEPEFPEWSLNIVGSGEQEDALRAQGKRLGLGRWKLSKATPEVEKAYREAGVYALSSRHEGLPMALMESQAYGVPAVAFDCPTGPSDLLSPGGGLLVEAEQIGAFATALRRLMSDPAARQRMSQKAFQHSNRYEAAHILDQWAVFMENLNLRSSGQIGVSKRESSPSS